LIQHIYKISDSDYRAQLEWLTRALDLKPLLMVPVRQLSLGQRMRCEIAAALLHRPSVLFLDEPTIGLDAVSKVAVRSIIKKINADQGVTVILTTHDMSDIEALASRVVLIGKGRKLYDGQLEVLKSRYIHTKNITVDHLGLRAETTFSDYLARGEDTVQSAVMRIASNSGCHLVKSHLGQLTVEVDLEKSSVPEVIQQLTTVLNVLDISVDAPAMDDVIVKLYKDLAI
jgi:ABC-2 type transport system ATP-binding protein